MFRVEDVYSLILQQNKLIKKKEKEKSVTINKFPLMFAFKSWQPVRDIVLLSTEVNKTSIIVSSSLKLNLCWKIFQEKKIAF